MRKAAQLWLSLTPVVIYDSPVVMTHTAAASGIGGGGAAVEGLAMQVRNARKAVLTPKV